MIRAVANLLLRGVLHVGCQPYLWCWWPVTQRGVRSDRVVVNPPAFSQHAQFFHRVEDLTVEELVPELGVEALAVAVLPGRAGFDVQRLCSCLCKPLP